MWNHWEQPLYTYKKSSCVGHSGDMQSPGGMPVSLYLLYIFLMHFMLTNLDPTLSSPYTTITSKFWMKKKIIWFCGALPGVMQSPGGAQKKIFFHSTFTTWLYNIFHSGALAGDWIQSKCFLASIVCRLQVVQNITSIPSTPDKLFWLCQQWN